MGAAPVAKRRNAQLHSRWSNRPRTFNGDCREVCLSPHLRFGARAMRCRGVARAFDEPLLHFSEKQRIRRAVAAEREFYCSHTVNTWCINTVSRRCSYVLTPLSEGVNTAVLRYLPLRYTPDRYYRPHDRYSYSYCRNRNGNRI
jgi:hypothetical protein